MRPSNDSTADLWALGAALGRAQANMMAPPLFRECGCCGAYHRADYQGDCRNDAERFQELPDDALLVEDDDVSMWLCAGCEGTPASRRHGYDLVRLAWDDARRTCVECGADCGVSVDHCGRCGYPVCRACGPLVMDAAGDVTVTCAQCAAVGSL